MALGYRTSALSTPATTNPRTLSVTIQSGDAVLVLGIAGANTTTRTGGAPTRGSQTFTQVSTTQVGSAECTAELWYILSPTVGTADISVPNTGSLSLALMAHILTGSGAQLFGQNQSSTSVQNPSLTINNVPAGGACVDVFASGWKDAATASDSGIYAEDPGAYTYHAQYGLNASQTNQVFTWTNGGSDDVAFVMAAFNEFSLTPLEQPGTDNNGSNWADAPPDKRMTQDADRSDTNQANWSDAARMAFTQAMSDSNLSNWADATLIRIGLSAADTGAANWNDLRQHQVAEVTEPLTLPCSDSNASNWSDATRIGFGLTGADSNVGNMADATLIAFALAGSDTNAANWNDARLIGFALSGSDTNVSNWNDAREQIGGLFYAGGSSNTGNWSDAMVIAFALACADTNQSNWSDARLSMFGLQTPDNLNNWYETGFINVGLAAPDTLSASDSAFLHFTISPTDTNESNWNDAGVAAPSGATTPLEIGLSDMSFGVVIREFAA